jgi:YfiH family protein
VLTADCLPVVIAQRNGLAIAVAHAGWRGLLAGVLGATLRTLPYAAADCIAWIGPAISQQVYEVGEDVATAVRQSVAFSAAAGSAAAGSAAAGIAAAPASNAAASGILAAGARDGKYQLDLFGLAARELAGLGIGTVYCERICTAASAALYSYRRDGVTGRMATVAWL